MARKRIAISSGGGIAAGSPFVLNGALFVQQAAPPVAKSGRLSQLADAVESLVAPATGAVAPNSLVLGEGATAFVGGDRSVLIGWHVRQNNGGVAQATDQVLIGNTIIVPPASTGSDRLIVIGSKTVFTLGGVFDSYGGNIAIGDAISLINSALAPCVNNVVIGAGALATAGASVSIGVGCRILAGAGSVTSDGVAIGRQATAYGSCVAIGAQSSASLVQHNVAVGRLAIATGGFAIALGGRCPAAGDRAIPLGALSDIQASGSIALGYDITIAAGSPNICVIGGRSYPILNFYVGSNVDDVTGAVSYSWNYTAVAAGAGNQLVGNTLVVQGGNGTGSWANAENRGIDFKCGLLAAAGSTQQPSTSVLALRHSDLNVALWGGLAATMGSGVKVLFIANCTTAPTVAPTGGGLLYVAAGALHWLGSGGSDTAIAPA